MRSVRLKQESLRLQAMVVLREPQLWERDGLKIRIITYVRRSQIIDLYGIAAARLRCSWIAFS
jgi:O-succinylbenzoate synthase